MVVQTLASVLALVICLVGFHQIITHSIEKQRTKLVPPFTDVARKQLDDMVEGVPADELPAAVALIHQIYDRAKQSPLLPVPAQSLAFPSESRLSALWGVLLVLPASGRLRATARRGSASSR